LAAALVVSCGEPTPGPASPSTDLEADGTAPGATTTSTTLAIRGETIPSTTMPAAVTGEVPADLLHEVIGNATARSGVPEGEITVVRGESVVWPDGSLGCPEPDQVYTQANVDGYWIVLTAAGKDYDYRATGSGFFKLCGPVLPLLPRPRGSP
jgi:hypothetical protein